MKGFDNYKKEVEKFRIHENSDSHLEGRLTYRSVNNPSIQEQLSCQAAKIQERKHACLQYTQNTFCAVHSVIPSNLSYDAGKKWGPFLAREDCAFMWVIHLLIVTTAHAVLNSSSSLSLSSTKFDLHLCQYLHYWSQPVENSAESSPILSKE